MDKPIRSRHHVTATVSDVQDDLDTTRGTGQGCRHRLRDRSEVRHARATLEHQRFVESVVLQAVCLVPISFAVVTRATLYEGMRHFLFVVLPLAVLAALGWVSCLRGVRRWPRIALSVLLAGSLLWTLCDYRSKRRFQYVGLNAGTAEIFLATTRNDCHRKWEGRVVPVVTRQGTPLLYIKELPGCDQARGTPASDKKLPARDL